MDDNFFHDAAEDYRASYEHHPVDDMEPDTGVAIETLSPKLRRQMMALAGQAFEKVIRWVSDDVPVTGYRLPNLKVDPRALKRGTIAIRALVVRYVLRPESFGEGINAALLAKRVGLTKQQFNWHVQQFRREFGFQSKVMRSGHARANMAEAMRRSHAIRNAKIRNEGAQARADGVAVSACPYQAGSKKASIWVESWEQRRDEE